MHARQRAGFGGGDHSVPHCVARGVCATVAAPAHQGDGPGKRLVAALECQLRFPDRQAFVAGLVDQGLDVPAELTHEVPPEGRLHWEAFWRFDAGRSFAGGQIPIRNPIPIRDITDWAERHGLIIEETIDLMQRLDLTLRHHLQQAERTAPKGRKAPAE